MEKAMFGAGCFWGVEEAFRTIDGVKDTKVGYSGGNTEDPTYEQVCSDRTGHAEVIWIEFDPAEGREIRKTTALSRGRQRCGKPPSAP